MAPCIIAADDHPDNVGIYSCRSNSMKTSIASLICLGIILSSLSNFTFSNQENTKNSQPIKLKKVPPSHQANKMLDEYMNPATPLDQQKVVTRIARLNALRVSISFDFNGRRYTIKEEQ